MSTRFSLPWLATVKTLAYPAFIFYLVKMPREDKPLIKPPPARPWGSSARDFRLRLRKRRIVPESDSDDLAVAAPLTKKQKLHRRQQPRPRPRRRPPQLAAACNEMQNLVEALARDEEFTDDGGATIGAEGSLDADDDLAELDDIQDATADADPSKMDLSDIDSLIEEVEKVCGPRPGLDSRKYALDTLIALIWQQRQRPTFHVHLGSA